MIQELLRITIRRFKLWALHKLNGTFQCLLEGKPPPKNMLKRSSGEISASKSLLCLLGCDLSSPYWSYCLRFSALLSTA